MTKHPTAEQKRYQTAAAQRAIGVICEAWPEALAAQAARGFPRSSPGPRAAAGVVRDTDPLHTRQMPPATAKIATFGDPTGDAAIQFDDLAFKWVLEARRVLSLILWDTEHRQPGRRRSLVHNPPALKGTLMAAVATMTEHWPSHTARVIERLHQLANTARREWPKTPPKGAMIDGTKVGERANTAEMCVECHKPVSGSADDPISRIDGQPYHRRPCYMTEYMRRRRAALAS